MVLSTKLLVLFQVVNAKTVKIFEWKATNSLYHFEIFANDRLAFMKAETGFQKKCLKWRILSFSAIFSYPLLLMFNVQCCPPKFKYTTHVLIISVWYICFIIIGVRKRFETVFKIFYHSFFMNCHSKWRKTTTLQIYKLSAW